MQSDYRTDSGVVYGVFRPAYGRLVRPRRKDIGLSVRDCGLGEMTRGVRSRRCCTVLVHGGAYLPITIFPPFRTAAEFSVSYQMLAPPAI